MFKRSKLEKQIDKIPTKVLWCKNCTMSTQDQELFLMKKVFVQHANIMNTKKLLIGI